MAASEDLISFDIIEHHKENIQSLPSGRSAKALASLFSPSPVDKFTASTTNATLNPLDEARESFEKEILNISESDDPLDIYDRYVKWTLDAYPSAQATTQSQLLPLLERATKTFLNSSHYKNDPRYLKLWLHYIRLFSDSPRETYAFLARHKVGEGLALFYEEFAAWLEGAGRWAQAEEVYKLGTEREARPIERLMRKYAEYKQRAEARPHDADEPSSPALPTVRPALAAKVDPFAASTPNPQPRPAVMGTSGSRSGKPKLAIFSDADTPPPETPSEAQGWENIGSLKDRKKENTIEPRPWAGETLRGGKRNTGMQKLAVFKDQFHENAMNASKNGLHLSESVNAKTGRVERVFVNLQAVYPDPTDPTNEMSFEELRALKRGWLDKDFSQPAPKTVELKPADDHTINLTEGTRRKSKKKVFGMKSETQTKSPSGRRVKRKPAEPTMTLFTRAATDEIYDIFSQPLQAEKTEEDEESQDESDDDYTDYTSAGESTTGHVYAADETEVLGDNDTGVLNGPETDETGKSASQWSDFTAQKHLPKDFTEDTTQTDTTNAASTTDSVSEEQIQPLTPASPKAEVRHRFIPIPPEDYEPPERVYRDAPNRLPFMTPIVEKTESSLGFLERDEEFTEAKTPCHNKSQSAEEPMSSPFNEISKEISLRTRALDTSKKLEEAKAVKTKLDAKKPVKGPLIQDRQCNPVDEQIRNIILENVYPPLSSFDGYHFSDVTFGMTAEIRKFSKAIGKGQSVAPVFSFEGSRRSYKLKKELGAGAFAPVYLVESSEKENTVEGAVMGEGNFQVARKPLEAFKMEDPPTAWEFYIMQQAQRRLGVSRAAESLVKAYEMHLYRDECFLVMEYRDQGTLLDLINIAKAESNSGGMDEMLAMFFSVELLRTVEALHSKGILHGDLKADNCLVRLEPCGEEWSSQYQHDGSHCWNLKGVAFIDFGRGIDMRCFEPGVQFVADWKTGPQDCAEMREMRPWTYQIDYHGLAGIIHTLLYGRYIESVVDRDGQTLGAGATKRYKVSTPMKRWWQAEIWTACFDLLLNPLLHVDGEEMASMPILKGMKKVRTLMEEWLAANAEKGPGLKNTIRRMEGLIKEKRR